MSSLYELIASSFSHLDRSLLQGTQEASSRYTNNTIGEETAIACAISLRDKKDIKRLIELAIEHNFTIQTISSGKNWGYGSVSANDDGRDIVLLDLARMNTITPIDKELGLISVEPGVTQQQLYDYLTQNNWRYMTPVTGAGPTCSILSNALERGYGITPYTDHFAAVNKLSAIIPNPKLWANEAKTYEYRSAIEELDLSEEKVVDHTFKWGLGSYIEGLFTQSSMGIVTDVTIRLAPSPEYFASFYIKIEGEDKLADTVNFIRDTLRDYEGIVGSINLMDKRRVLSMVAENPNGPAKHQVMSSEQISYLSKRKDVSDWMVVGSIYGKKPVVKAVKKLIKQGSAGISKQTLFSDSLLIKSGKFVSRLLPIGPLKAIKTQLDTLDEGIDIMLGKPRQVALPLAYWRNPRFTPNKSLDLNPDQHECGLLWYAPIIPMNADKIADFVDLVRRTTPKYHIEPLITLTNLKYDCIDATIPIIYDLKNLQAKQNAADCLNELVYEGRKLGYIPYRINVAQQRNLLSPNTMHWQLVKSIKQTLDPHNILAPKRYNP